MARTRIHIAGLIAAGALLVLPASASALTYTVDNTANGQAQPCTLAAADCSLRSAITLSNASAGTTDTIAFDPAIFTGGAGSTIIVNNNDPTALVLGDPVNIVGGDCDATPAGAKPCVGIDATGGGSALLPNAANISISGISFIGNPTMAGIGTTGAATGLTVTGSWFGVALDGTTLQEVSGGVSLLNTGVAAIGGDTPAERNVFAKSTNSAISVAGGGSHVFKGNYFGTLPDGSVVAGPGSNGISLQGNTAGNTIGGDATTPGQCDGECNLIGNFTASGIALVNAGGSPSGTGIFGNFIGLGLNGTADLGNGGTGISVGDSPATTIGAAAATRRNFIAANDDGGVTANGATGLAAVNNYIGLSVDGTVSLPNTRAVDGAGLASGSEGGTFTDNRFGGNGLRIGGTSTVKGNVIGVGPGGQDLGITGEPGLQIDGNTSTIGGSTAAEANTIGNVKTAPNAAVLLQSGASGNLITGNFIGTTSTGIPAPNAARGVQLGGSNSLDGNEVGFPTAGSENVISNSGGDAIAQVQAGDFNRYHGNVGENNGTTANDLFVDVGADGQGNPGGTGFYNDDVLAPSGVTASGTLIQGPAGSVRNAATVEVYATYSSRGDVRQLLGQTTAGIDGSWNLSIGPFPNGQCVSANQTDVNFNSSELAPTVTIGGGPCVAPPFATIDSGPVEGSTIAGTTAAFGFSGEAGATFECKIDGGSFAACSSPFTTPVLAPGSHAFQVRAVQSTLHPALSPELGAPVTRTFIVPTPVVAPGPTGQRAAALKKCKKKKTKKAKKKCRKKAKKLPV